MEWSRQRAARAAVRHDQYMTGLERRSRLAFEAKYRALRRRAKTGLDTLLDAVDVLLDTERGTPISRLYETHCGGRAARGGRGLPRLRAPRRARPRGRAGCALRRPAPLSPRPSPVAFRGGGRRRDAARRHRGDAQAGLGRLGGTAGRRAPAPSARPRKSNGRNPWPI